MQLVIEELGWKLVPERQGLCFELWRYVPEHIAAKGPHKGNTVSAGWKSAGRYYNTVQQALVYIAEQSAISDPEVVNGLKPAIRKLDGIRDSILKAEWRIPT